MDQAIRNKLRNVVTQCRKLLEDDTREALEGKFGIFAKKDQVTADPDAVMAHLSADDQAARKDILEHLAHIKARGFKPKESLDQLIREIAFTHLNRLCAYKMMEAREVWVGGQKFREAVTRGVNSNGVKFYLADHPEELRLFETGHQDIAYRHFLDWLGALLSEEIGVLFNPNDPANRLYPRQATLDDVLELLNKGGIKSDETELQSAWPEIWSQDETIGWVYQYFTPKELRDVARDPKRGGSQAPRNSYELAFRNQFFTPRYVVEFLTDNTLGRIWYEMRQGQTRLKEQCRYMVRRPDEVFLAASTCEGHQHFDAKCAEIARQLQESDETVVPPFSGSSTDEIQRMIELAHCVDGYQRHAADDGVTWQWMSEQSQAIAHDAEAIRRLSTQEILDLLFLTCRNDRHAGDGSVYRERWFVDAANEVRRRALSSRREGATQEELLRSPVFIPHRQPKDTLELKILDPACGSGHFLLYCFDLLLTIYEEAYADPDVGSTLREEYPTLEALRRDVPSVILAHNLHGIDIDLRATQIAALALWLRCQRAYRELGIKQSRVKISKSNIVCAEPMPGEKEMLDEFLKSLKPDRLEMLIERVMQVPERSRVRTTESMVESLTELVRLIWDRMKLAGEAGSLLKIEEELQAAVRTGQEEWEEKQPLFRFTEFSLTEKPKETLVRYVAGEGMTFWQRAEALVLEALREYARHASNGGPLQRQLFADDAERGFAFIDICQKRFDVVLMNPPFGMTSSGSKDYLSDSYPASKADLFAAFVERGVLCLASRGRIGAITNRTGFFLSSLSDWRTTLFLERTALAALADLGHGVLDTAMVETAAYVAEKHLLASPTVFIRAVDLPVEEKSTCLIPRLDLHSANSFTYCSYAAHFTAIPGTPFAYWAGLFTSSACICK